MKCSGKAVDPNQRKECHECSDEFTSNPDMEKHLDNIHTNYEKYIRFPLLALILAFFAHRKFLL